MSFSFEFVVEIFVSSFEFKFLEFSRRISNSSFSFRCSIRLLEFRCSIRFLEFQFSIRVSIRISNSSSLIFSCRIRRRNFRCLALFDFSNFNFRFEFVVEIFDVLLYSTSRKRSSNSISRISSSRVKSLEFRIRLDLFDFSNFDDYQVLEIVVDIVVLEVAFFI